MKRSVDRILTTHTGSLVRPPELLAFARARQKREPIDEKAFDSTLRSAVHDVVARQVKAGIDVPNDGEFGKSTSWSLYVLKRLSGFEMREVKGANPFARGADRAKFREFYDELEGRGDGKDWSNVTRFDAVCVGDIKYNGLFELQRDIDNLKAAAKAAGVDEAFLPVAAPSSAIPDRKNEYYKTDEDLVVALAEALRTEYRAIVDAGFLLQVDDARAAVTYDRMVPPATFRGVLPVARPPRGDSQSRARRHPGRSRSLPRVLGQLAGTAHHGRSASENRRPDSEGQCGRIPAGSGQSASRARVEGVAGGEAARRGRFSSPAW